MMQNKTVIAIPASTLPTESHWSSLYKLGGAAALLAVLAFLVDIAISMASEDISPAAFTAVDWFALFQANGLAGLRALGLINVVSLIVSMPLYLSLYTAHQPVNRGFAALALMIYLVGAAVYISNNAAVPMFVLSGQYATAATETQRTILAAAGEAVLVRGTDFAPGSFAGFVLTEIAGLGFATLMLKSGIFSKAAAWFGIVGFMLLSVFTIWATFLPSQFDAAMGVAMVGGLASVAWYVLTARGLFNLGWAEKQNISVGALACQE